MAATWWDVLSDGELRARLFNRLDSDADRARRLVERREDEDVRPVITEILGS